MASSAEAPTTLDAATVLEENLGKGQETFAMKIEETTTTTEVEETLASNEARIDSIGQGGVEPSCSFSEASSTVAGEDTEKTLEHAAELMDRGSKALKDGDYTEAAECFSRAVEIRVAHYGELAPECAGAYYKYGCALLYKAQEEADPLGAIAKKEVSSLQNPSRDGSTSANDGESSTTSAVAEGKHDEDSSLSGEEQVNGAGSKDQVEDGDEESEDEDLAEADEDESDLDLAWKMLDIARAIVEKHPGDTIEKVDILSALAEVALEREDIETSINDYLKALSILEHLVEPDSRQIAELNFRICLCLEVGSKAEEAIPYCQKASSICKARVERLINEVNELKSKTGSGETVDVDDLKLKHQQSSAGSQAEPSVSDKESEIGTLKELSSELEKKLEDLQQLVSNPLSIFSEVLKMASAKATGSQKSSPSSAMSSSQMGTITGSVGFDSPTVSTAHTNETGGVTHLGVVGRGIKRPMMNPGSAEPSPLKKQLSQDSSEKKGDPVKKPTLDSSGEKSEGSIC